jgi:hypothetical protein
MDIESIDDFAFRFQACTLRKDEWTHHSHLVVGLWHVDRYGADEALTRLRAGIRRLNESFGGANTATSGYHETITAAYVRLLSQFLDRREDGEVIGDLVTRLLGGPLAAKDVLFAFYSRERLMSVEARAAWVEPDLAPLVLSAVVDVSA